VSWLFRDVSEDGQRFLMVKQLPATETTARTPEIVVEGWFEELKASRRRSDIGCMSLKGTMEESPSQTPRPGA
jgi:hypothetical protein